FTAHDAHLRDYEIIVPSDCVASNTPQETRMALANMKKAAHAVICKSAAINFKDSERRSGNSRPARTSAHHLTKKSA
ncbi:MAG TPA: isochorismatase family protein, partial [Candidatus Angelobacter sp.]